MTSTLDPQEPLSPQQAKILGFIEAEISRDGRPPTYRDIARHFGFSAVGTVQDYIQALIKKGYLEKDPSLARGIRLKHRNPSLSIPILGSIPAGRPLEALENTLGYLSLPLLPQGTLNKEKGGGKPLYAFQVYALQVRGQSMKDAGIFEGDYVIVKKQNHADNGDIVVALIDHEATVKFFEKKAGRIRLLPANPDFSPIELHPNRENRIDGKVIAVQRYY